ncbi:hypothetical protein [Parasphingorhabdus sp.]|uniref:hypothetical protein n=1 Tax=Parasphingorhabdus sp. TaxID=2709688 RepID=UPI002B271A1E|nr:hypothetical protein [Parasphingorhabdus sp.]
MQNFEQDDSSEMVENVGVQASSLGSFVPEAHYRPIPIVWFAGAWFIQCFAMMVLFVVLLSKAQIFTLLTCAIVTYGLWHWTNQRGMKDASTGWKVTTIVALGFNYLVLVLATLGS